VVELKGIEPVSGPTHNVGFVCVLASEAAPPGGNQTAWVIVTYDGSSSASPVVPADFPGQLAVAILAVGDPGGSGV
jgi:hypothetical protein